MSSRCNRHLGCEDKGHHSQQCRQAGVGGAPHFGAQGPHRHCWQAEAAAGGHSRQHRGWPASCSCLSGPGHAVVEGLPDLPSRSAQQLHPGAAVALGSPLLSHGDEAQASVIYSLNCFRPLCGLAQPSCTVIVMRDPNLLKPQGCRHVSPGAVTMMAYPMQRMTAFKQQGDRPQFFGLCLRIGESGWAPPLPLEIYRSGEQRQQQPGG
ncbi:hypothetical protein WJX79_003576 [Trebouxia sp. C0005]